MRTIYFLQRRKFLPEVSLSHIPVDLPEVCSIPHPLETTRRLTGTLTVCVGTPEARVRLSPGHRDSKQNEVHTERGRLVVRLQTFCVTARDPEHTPSDQPAPHFFNPFAPSRCLAACLHSGLANQEFRIV